MFRSPRPVTAEFPRRHAAALAIASAALALVPAVAQADTTIQGEALALSPATAGFSFTDTSALGAKALKIHSNGSASKSVVTSERSANLLVRARGQQCSGAPEMTIAVDGIRRLTAFVPQTTYREFTVAVTLAEGTHVVKVSYANDLRSSSCDRNLILDSVTFGAAPTTTPPGWPVPVVTPTPTPTPGPLPTPTPEPTPTPTPDTSAQLRPDYDSAWGTGNYSNGASGPFVGAIHRERISIVDDPAGLPRKVARFAPKDSDIGPTENPRAQLELPRFIDSGEEVWQGLSVFYPANFSRTVSSPGGGSFVTHTSQAAPPHSGTAAVSFGSYGGTYRFGARLNGSGTYAWSVAPMVAKWEDFVIRMKVGKPGFLEIWHNDGHGLIKQTMTNSGPGGTIGTVSADGKRWIGTTNESSTQTPPLDSRLALYWKRGMWSVDPVLYYGPAKWRVRRAADTDTELLAAVNPRSYKP